MELPIGGVPPPVPKDAVKETPLPPNPVDLTVLKTLNAYRHAAGLGLVSVDPASSSGCAAHAGYLVRNRQQGSVYGLEAHNELPGMPGYTEEGARAGSSSVIQQIIGPAAGFWQAGAVDSWMGTLYHRLPLLRPDLKKVGIGYAATNRQFHVIVLGNFGGLGAGFGRVPDRDPMKPVVFPVDNQKNVPCLFCFGNPEIPNPIPDNGDSHETGYPITVTFPEEMSIEDVEATLKSPGGVRVPAWVSSPAQPANPTFPQYGTIAIIAQQPLRARTTYSVAVSARINKTAWSRSWRFSTGLN